VIENNIGVHNPQTSYETVAEIGIKTVHTVTVLSPWDQTNESIIEEEPIVALFHRD
jgi:hypothetical protein